MMVTSGLASTGGDACTLTESDTAATTTSLVWVVVWDFRFFVTSFRCIVSVEAPAVVSGLVASRGVWWVFLRFVFLEEGTFRLWLS